MVPQLAGLGGERRSSPEHRVSQLAELAARSTAPNGIGPIRSIVVPYDSGVVQLRNSGGTARQGHATVTCSPSLNAMPAA